jgi:acetyltransferase-like isoleucine patch superfamily enzyme
MLKKYRYENWSKTYPTSFLEYMHSPCGRGLRIINFIYQKIFKINACVPFMVHFSSIVNGKIVIGKGVARYFANINGFYIQGINGVYIGDDSMFAPGIKIISANHNPESLDEHIKSDPVIIGNNCWIGANAVILPGVVLGDNVVVAAGSVVTKSFESNVIVAGVPAKVIKTKKVI